MNIDEKLAAIACGVEAGEEERVVQLVQDALVEGVSAATILNQGLVRGMTSLGALFGAGEVFLPEVLVSAEALNAAVELLEPHLLADGVEAKGKVLIGSVAGDVHSIGKNLVAVLLRGNGFDVQDLGVDVSAEAFVAAVRDNDPDILAMSALLSSTAPEFSSVIDALGDAGLRGRVRVLVGGAPVTPEIAEKLGADGYAEDCVAAVAEAVKLIEARGER